MAFAIAFVGAVTLAVAIAVAIAVDLTVALIADAAVAVAGRAAAVCYSCCMLLHAVARCCMLLMVLFSQICFRCLSDGVFATTATMVSVASTTATAAAMTAKVAKTFFISFHDTWSLLDAACLQKHVIG